jgi:transcription elongation factor Elf1
MPRDSGGWRSGPGREVTCPRCSNDKASMFETVIYGKRTDTIFCNVCASEFETSARRDDDEPIDDRR